MGKQAFRKWVLLLWLALVQSLSLTLLVMFLYLQETEKPVTYYFDVVTVSHKFELFRSQYSSSFSCRFKPIK